METKFGKIPCIVRSGETLNTTKYFWKRHFGKGVGVVKYESYSIRNRDTFNWKSNELDLFY